MSFTCRKPEQNARPRGERDDKPLLLAWQVRAMLLLIAVVCTLWSSVVASAAERSLWQFTPYRVQILIALERDPALTPALAAGFRRQLMQRTEAMVGSPWEVECREARGALAHVMRWRFDEIAFEDAPDSSRSFDKVMFVRLSQIHGGIRITVRELDVRTRMFNSTAQRDCRQRRLLATAAFEAILQAFSPLAQVQFVEKRAVKLQLQAAALPLRDPSLKVLTKGQVFQPIIRLNRRDGTVQIQPIPWTFLAVESREGSEVACRMHSGFRNPFTSRRRGRFEKLALAVDPPNKPTRLSLFSNSDKDFPLAGYEIHSYSPDSPATELLGYTDLHGSLTIPPSDGHPLRLLIVKNGGAPLAKLPLIPGLEATVRAEITNDEERLRVEGFITGLQDRLIDIVARRRFLIARVHQRIDVDKLELAEKIFEDLRNLPTRESLLEELHRFELTVLTIDPKLKRKIDKLFGDTRKVVNAFLKSKPVDDLSAQLKSARLAAQ